MEHLRKYLDVEVLKQKKSVDNYFIYIVDFFIRKSFLNVSPRFYPRTYR